jgi:hypothetical protein
MKVRVLVLTATLTVLLVGLLAAPAQAATSQGCVGTLTAEGPSVGTVAVSTVAVPGPSGTNANPFQLYWAEPVSWTAQTYAPMTDGTWRLTVQNSSWLFALGELVTGHIRGLTGTFSSAEGGTTFSNSFTPSAIEPVTLPGRYEIGFTVTGSGGAKCTGTISVRVMDPPGHNPFWWLALLLIIAGLVLLAVYGVSKLTRPVVVRADDQGKKMKYTGSRHVPSNTIGGLFLGIGVSLMLTLYGVVGWSTITPDLVIVLGLVLGLGVGLLPVRSTGEPAVTRATRDYSSLSS